MNWATLGLVPLGAALLGILSHLAFFIRGEWHMRVPALIASYSIFTIFLLYAEYSVVGDFSTSIKVVRDSILSYAGSLFTSIIIYRRYFHRLRAFPGPPFASITKFWHLWKSFGGKNHLLIEQLSRRYGSIIRTGPEELTIIDAAIPHIIDSSKSQFTKATFYDVVLPMVAINTTRNADDHDSRRRIWNKGFSSKAMAGYENLVLRYVELLAHQIENQVHEKSSTTSPKGPIINVTDWFSWFAFDVMGEFGFSRSFQMLQDRKWHSKIRLLVDGMSAGSSLTPVPWLAQLGKSVMPRVSLVKNWNSMLQWCSECMDERRQMKGEYLDLSHWLINAYIEDGYRQTDLAWLNGDAVTLIVAGSGTVSVVLTFAFYHLAKNPSQQEKLYNEIKDIDVCDRVQLQNCTHLTAFINEALRLYPPVPTGGNRVTPPAGVTINGTYIPGGVTIVAPKYSIHRLESSYVSADQFIPERWTTRPDMIKDNSGFAPFSLGKYGCIGKTLAMTEMRLVISFLLKKFEIKFQDSDAGETLFASLKDNFTFDAGNLHLKFLMRGGA
ncbi:cytochrome P450 [Xylaria sp. FL1042]|nr:cytochrome P450 [Xylaria sp. FL1042]